MVRLQRNDAPPRQTINLVSDEEEQQPSNSSSSSSNSSNYSSSSESDEHPVISPSSSLSDFIEEDDEPRPALKSSSSSWEPIKPRRKRLRTLRKKPRLDKIEADDEPSTSSDSTSSEGIPRPQVEIDADEEEDHVKMAPKRTPKKRKRPRRAAAPPCFLDAVNKFVEPMSKDARKYQNLTLSQILYGESEDEDQPEDSDDLSVEYVPHTPAKMAANTQVVSDDSDGSGDNGFDTDESPRNGGSDQSRRNQRVSSQPRTSYIPSGVIASPTQSDGGNPSDTGDQNNGGYNNRACASKRRSTGKRRYSPESADTEENERRPNVPEGQRDELHELNDPEPTEPLYRKLNEGDVQKEPAGYNCEGEVIDLCSDDECDAIRFEDGVPYSKSASVSVRKDLAIEHTLSKATGGTARTHLLAPEREATRTHDVENGSSSREDDKPNVEAEGAYCSPHYAFARECANESSILGAFSETKTAPQDHLSMPGEGVPTAFKRQEELTRCINNNCENYDTGRKTESQPQTCNEEAKLDPIREPGSKKDISIMVGEGSRCSDLVSGSDSAQTHPTSAGNQGSNTKPENSTIVLPRPGYRFKGAKRRGNMPHPDVLRKRVPHSQEERRAWLEFAKAEARDIHRAFAADEPSQTYSCASTEMVFIRQILAELGKLMGLKVHSEKDEAGRRIVFEKLTLGSVGGSEEEVQQVIERFFHNALADMLDERQSKNSKHNRARNLERKAMNESPKASAELTAKSQLTREDGNALPRVGQSRATNNCNRKRGGKGKRSSRVVGKASNRNHS